MFLRVIIRSLFSVPGAIVDPKGFGFLNLMLENANVPFKYRYMFSTDMDDAVFIDCGANVGLIIDIARFMNMEVYAFEPNPKAVRLLDKKYFDDKKVHIYPNAVSNKNGTMDFYINDKELFDQSATIIKECAEIEGGKGEKIQVDIVRLVDIIKNDILSKHKNIHLLKLDIEGAEFDVIEDIVNEGLYKSINYIVVETHERFFKDGKLKLRNLQKTINELGIKNIYLDRI